MEINQKLPFYNISDDETIVKLKSDKDKGLHYDEVKKRREQFGENKLPEKGKKTALMIFFKQFKDFLILILAIAAGISWYLEEMADVYIIIAVILFNAIMGFTQEFKAEKAIESIKKMVKHTATVIRNGEKERIEATELVPGDLIEIEKGESVPADARLIKIKNLQAIEASLTGESVPVSKEQKIIEDNAPVGDRVNMVFKGTQIARGYCRAVVTATGKQTELGKIASSLSEMKKTTSAFKNKTGKLAKKMAALAIVTATMVFLVGYYVRGFEFEEILLVTIATLVSSIPEGLPVVISIVLAIGAKRMARKNAIIREFSATEMLGSVTTILTDKTGTITQSILTVKKMFINKDLETEVSGKGYQLEGEVTSNGESIQLGQDDRLDKLAVIAAYCNNSSIKDEHGDDEEYKNNNKEQKSFREKKLKTDEPDINKETKITGDPTEVALLVLSKKLGVQFNEKYKNLKVIDDLPFSSETKFRASLVQYPDGKKEIFLVGAPEKILNLSSKIILKENTEDFNDELKEKIREVIDNYTGNAMRVIALAYKSVSVDKNSVEENDAKDLVWTGITGIIDPPAEGVKEAITAAREAGVRIIMVTGDHKETARAIAQQVGIINKSEKAISARELNENNFSESINNINVFARVDPAIKLKICEFLQDKGELVVMTGDGVNDAPALKRADVGIAMGQRGTDVAKDSAQMVLSDDNFSTIVSAIEEGRIVFKNIRNTSFFLITTNVASAMAIFVCIAIGLPLPLLAAQILFVNLVTDGIMDVALATEPGHGDIMKQKPYGRNEHILNKQVIPNLVLIGVLMVVMTIMVFKYYLPQDISTARTGAFLIISMTQLFNAFNLRAPDASIFKIGFLTNKWVIIAFFASVITQLAVIKLEFFQEIFSFSDLPWLDILIIFLISSVILWFGELYKYSKMKFGWKI